MLIYLFYDASKLVIESRNNKTMTKAEKVQLIIDYYNEHFKWQQLVYDRYIDREKVEALTEEQLDEFISKNCK